MIGYLYNTYFSSDYGECHVETLILQFKMSVDKSTKSLEHPAFITEWTSNPENVS